MYDVCFCMTHQHPLGANYSVSGRSCHLTSHLVVSSVVSLEMVINVIEKSFRAWMSATGCLHLQPINGVV